MLPLTLIPVQILELENLHFSLFQYYHVVWHGADCQITSLELSFLICIKMIYNKRILNSFTIKKSYVFFTFQDRSVINSTNNSWVSLMSNKCLFHEANLTTPPHPWQLDLLTQVKITYSLGHSFDIYYFTPHLKYSITSLIAEFMPLHIFDK